MSSHLEQFNKHEVTEFTLQDGEVRIERLVWKDPSTITGRLEYVMIASTLLIKGDFGSAVFQWYPDEGLSLRSVSTFSEYYFSEKCVASEFGQRFEQWDEYWLASQLKEYREELDGDRLRDFDEAWMELNQFCFHDQECWQSTLEDYQDRIFGDDDPFTGYRMHDKCVLFLQGLKDAFAWLDKNKRDHTSLYLKDENQRLTELVEQLSHLNADLLTQRDEYDARRREAMKTSEERRLEIWELKKQIEELRGT